MPTATSSSAFFLQVIIFVNSKDIVDVYTNLLNLAISLSKVP